MLHSKMGASISQQIANINNNNAPYLISPFRKMDSPFVLFHFGMARYYASKCRIRPYSHYHFCVRHIGKKQNKAEKVGSSWINYVIDEGMEIPGHLSTLHFKWQSCRPLNGN